MYGRAAGLAALGALYPPALVIAAVYLSSASPRKLAGLFVTGAVLMTTVAGIVILEALRAGGLGLPANRPVRYGLRVGLGAVALIAAGYLIWRYRNHPAPDPAKASNPGRISRMAAHPRPLTALAVGVVLFAPGVGFIAAVQVIATAKASLSATVTAMVMVVVIDLVFAWLPVVVYLIAPEATTRGLRSLSTWLGQHGRALLTGSLGAVGTILVIDGVVGLA
jgi:hypothetical protein